MVKVSVIIPCKNAEGTVGGAIESILRQTYKDLELIVINDSSDNSRHIIESFDDDRLKPYHISNIGLCTSLNTGITKSTGDYIARLDADDISLPDRILIESTFLDQNPNVALVGAQAFFRQANKVYSSPLASKITSPVALNNRLFKVNPLIASTTMMRRDAMLEIGGFDLSFDKWPYAGDYDMAIRLAKRFPVMMIPDYVGLYTISSSSLSTGRSIDRFVSLCLAKKRALSLARNPRDASATIFSLFRSVGIDLVTRITNDRIYNYTLNVGTRL